MKPYFETDLGVLYHGDCLEIMPQLEPVDLVLTDPPYGLDKKLSSGAGKHKNAKFRLNYENENWDKPITKNHLDLIFSAAKNQIIFGANYYEMPPTRGIICWNKQQYMPTFSAWEYAWTSFERPAKMYTVNNGSENRHHPTQKPIFLFVCILNDTTAKTILDPFLGSGTTAVACEQLNRRWIGIEISEKYCEIAAKRIERERQQLKLFQPEPPKPKPEQKSLFRG
jgi:site-specific DNA-methyltransferase (adenine-specific)